MLRAIILLIVFFALLVATVFYPDLKSVMALAGIAATCVGLNWLTSHSES